MKCRQSKKPFSFTNTLFFQSNLGPRFPRCEVFWSRPGRLFFYFTPINYCSPGILFCYGHSSNSHASHFPWYSLCVRKLFFYFTAIPLASSTALFCYGVGRKPGLRRIPSYFLYTSFISLHFPSYFLHFPAFSSLFPLCCQCIPSFPFTFSSFSFIFLFLSFDLLQFPSYFRYISFICHSCTKTFLLFYSNHFGLLRGPFLLRLGAEARAAVRSPRASRLQ